jgi:hypothetical protein
VERQLPNPFVREHVAPLHPGFGARCRRHRKLGPGVHSTNTTTTTTGGGGPTPASDWTAMFVAISVPSATDASVWGFGACNNFPLSLWKKPAASHLHLGQLLQVGPFLIGARVRCLLLNRDRYSLTVSVCSKKNR